MIINLVGHQNEVKWGVWNVQWTAKEPLPNHLILGGQSVFGHQRVLNPFPLWQWQRLREVLWLKSLWMITLSAREAKSGLQFFWQFDLSDFYSTNRNSNQETVIQADLTDYNRAVPWTLLAYRCSQSYVETRKNLECTSIVQLFLKHFKKNESNGNSVSKESKTLQPEQDY